ncbi:MAG: glycosyltransferase [Halieaceae bacterium]|jgi:glycosyltransferase involved in cell wall biosynthesis|nr:glycosyltransferase [Halieaceae bacterium]
MSDISALPGAVRENFRDSASREFRRFLDDAATAYPEEECLRIDLHCHDRNSDVPDELWARILGVPETWLKTKQLYKTLLANGTTAQTITNHNNARSCWELLDQGYDVLSGAEFTCHFPDIDLSCHVLAYGFTPQQETRLLRKRRNIYRFIEEALAEDIPLVLPHPLYFYSRNEELSPQLYERIALMFQRLEVLNGQRDLWQSTLTLAWTQQLTPERLSDYARRHGIRPEDFGVDIEAPKVLTGGSDCHTGLFAGQSGTRLYVPDLAVRLQTEKPSALALEALRDGRAMPYGDVGESQKLNIAILDYFSQMATHMEDPGLLRILLHNGETNDKLACFAISNVMLELRRNKTSRKFFSFVHDALHGKRPNKLLKWNVSKKNRYFLQVLERIAGAKGLPPTAFVEEVNSAIEDLFRQTQLAIIDRIRESELISEGDLSLRLSAESLLENVELPSQLSSLFLGAPNRHKHGSDAALSELCASLALPSLTALVVAGAAATSTRAFYSNRDFLNKFADSLGTHGHDSRALYLTDTLFDRNGVSSSLGNKLREIQRYDLPVDFLIAHREAANAPHLHVMEPLAWFNLENAGGQEIRIPDLLQVANHFREGGYDRVVCSTEGPMIAAALLIKYMYNVPALFFMHTDWLEYVERTASATRHERDRLRRILRLIYSQFDGIFVLNQEHKAWLSSHEISIPPEKVFLTAHHVNPPSPGVRPISKQALFPDATERTPVLFAAGRLSREKGCEDIIEVYRQAKRSIPDLRLVIAGMGPEEEAMRAALPEAHFLGWVSQDELASYYQGLDLFLFPSRFDTFGNVLLEAFSNGMPAVSYACKGPADLILDGRCGYLVDTPREMATRIVEHFRDTARHDAFREAAIARSRDFDANRIMGQFLADMVLTPPACPLETRSAA